MFRPPSFAVSMFVVFGIACLSAVSAQEPRYQTPRPVLMNGPMSSEAGIVNEAAFVLQELTSGTVTAIPERLLASAEAIAIVPHFVRGAFVIGVGGGRGVLIRRDRDQNWRAPEFIDLFGGGVGWQVGIQATDLVLVFRSPGSLQNMQQGKVTLGGDVSVAAGPIGRTASAATDRDLRAEILSYSRSRGLYAGISLNGSSLQLDLPATQRYYQITPTSQGVVPPAAIALVNELNTLARVRAPSQHPQNETTMPSPRPTLSADPPRHAEDEVELQWRAETIEEIASSIASLQTRLDAQWQEYLVLPTSWKEPASVTPEDIQAVVVRYERVATNPQFAALSSQPEFVRILKLLRKLAVEAAEQSRLNLPPPPGG